MKLHKNLGGKQLRMLGNICFGINLNNLDSQNFTAQAALHKQTVNYTGYIEIDYNL